jgi:hypothetical protein
LSRADVDRLALLVLVLGLAFAIPVAIIEALKPAAAVVAAEGGR